MNLYSVSRINKSDKTETMIADGLTNIEVVRLTGITHAAVANYANKGNIASGMYKIYITGEVDRGDIEKRWNDIRYAVKLLKSGHGKIVKINGKKVTVRV